MRIIALVGAATLMCPTSASAQAGGTAHLYAYKIRDRGAFENGYRQHLRWHAAMRDALPWFAWYVVKGARAGAFVDGTFGITPEAFAGRVNPTGDGADFKANVAAYVEPLGNEGWMYWREPSTAATLEKRKPEKFMKAYVMETNDRDAFERAVLARKSSTKRAWYRATTAPAGQYLLLAPARPKARDDVIVSGLPARIVRVETWRYQPRLALMPGSSLVK